MGKIFLFLGYFSDRGWAELGLKAGTTHTQLCLLTKGLTFSMG
jgi:hypothetical protein